jgi:hypothetical protein
MIKKCLIPNFYLEFYIYTFHLFFIYKWVQHNNTSWVLQPVNKTMIVCFYYNCNYKFMLMTT